ncbi:cytochrome P450 [Mycolicibacterium sp. XJ1819]
MPDTINRMTAVTDYHEIADVLSSPDFARTDPMTTPFKLETISLTSGEEHAHRRRLEAKHFRPAVLRTTRAEAVQAAIDHVFGEVLGDAAGDEPVITDLATMLPRITTLVVAQFVGLQLPESTDQALDELTHYMVFVNSAAGLMFSRKDPIEEAWEIRRALVEFTDRYVMPAIRDRRENGPRGDDLISTLVTAYDATRWDGELITREATFYMVAGVRSTSNTVLDTLNHLIDYLSEHPQAREAALDESNEFLVRAVGEALRLHVPNPALTRRAIRSGKTRGGRTYAEGDELVLHIPAAHLDAELFGENPEQFNPYRQTAKGIPLWGLAFGHGEHACIGRALALGRFDSGMYQGSTVSILRDLLAHGVDRVPGQPPTVSADNFKTVYTSYPAQLYRIQARNSSNG